MSTEVFFFKTRTMTLYLDLLFSSDVISIFAYFVRFFPKSSMLDILNEHIFPYQDPCPMQDVSTGWLTLRTAPAARQKTPLHLQSILRMIVQSRVWCRFLPSKILQWPFIACLLASSYSFLSMSGVLRPPKDGKYSAQFVWPTGGDSGVLMFNLCLTLQGTGSDGTCRV